MHLTEYRAVTQESTGRERLWAQQTGLTGSQAGQVLVFHVFSASEQSGLGGQLLNPQGE